MKLATFRGGVFGSEANHVANRRLEGLRFCLRSGAGCMFRLPAGPEPIAGPPVSPAMATVETTPLLPSGAPPEASDLRMLRRKP